MEVTKQNTELDESKKEFRVKVNDFENALKNVEGSFQGDTKVCPLKHSFSDNMYVREISIPEGVVLTGKIHKHDHPNFLMSGTVVVVTEDGGEEILEGPLAMISPPGTKRALFALTDLVWITVHHNPTNTRDLKELEERVIAPSYEDYEKFKNGEKSLGTRLKKKIVNLLS